MRVIRSMKGDVKRKHFPADGGSSMKGDVKRKHFPADGGSWISLASRPCAMESRRSGRRLELDIHAVPLMPTEPGRMQAAGLGLPTMVLRSEERRVGNECRARRCT